MKLKGFFNKTTVMCLLLGACLAVLLAIFVSRDKSITTPLAGNTQLAESQSVEDILNDTDDDMTDIIGYDLYGTHTVTGDGIKDKTLTFKENGTASGYIGKDFGEANGVHWSVSMDEGILHINFTGSKDAIQYVFSYDDDMNIVLTGEKETLTLTKK